MRRFGLIGHPLGHSFSQKYFTGKFASEGIHGCQYELFPIPDITLFPSLWETYPDLVGLNVTIPYKEKVIHYLDEMSDVVRSSGACNCIHRTPEGLVGHNTDVMGFERSLAPGLRPSHREALILGTGGASKAVAFVLGRMGIRYRFVSRSGVGDVGSLSYAELDEAVMFKHTLIVNTTPLGTFPDIDTAPALPYHLIGPGHYLFDLVYNPPVTRFLAEGMKRGATTRNGSDMLAIQAEESWRIWNPGV
ncbi:MAG: shikimate dehydrogenase [Chitinophagia bacterium]|nr:shikimate dehydrogenase [Chitinophagia bacterium]